MKDMNDQERKAYLDEQKKKEEIDKMSVLEKKLQGVCIFIYDVMYCIAR